MWARRCQATSGKAVTPGVERPAGTQPVGAPGALDRRAQVGPKLGRVRQLVAEAPG